jgi:hypothetical protein
LGASLAGEAHAANAGTNTSGAGGLYSSEAWVLLESQPVYDGAGHIVGYTGQPVQVCPGPPARVGFDAIVLDLSALPFEQNVRQTKEAVEALKTINSAILVKGEIGDIGTGSEIHLLTLQGSTFWLRPWATCTGC